MSFLTCLRQCEDVRMWQCEDKSQDGMRLFKIKLVSSGLYIEDIRIKKGLL